MVYKKIAIINKNINKLIFLFICPLSKDELVKLPF